MTHQRQRFLYGEHHAFDVDAECAIKRFFDDRADWLEITQASIGEQHIDSAFIRFDWREDVFQIALGRITRSTAVSRVDYQEIPPKVEYSLTPFGHSLVTALGALCAWGAEHMQTVERISGRRAAALT